MTYRYEDMDKLTACHGVSQMELSITGRRTRCVRGAWGIPSRVELHPMPPPPPRFNMWKRIMGFANLYPSARRISSSRQQPVSPSRRE